MVEKVMNERKYFLDAPLCGFQETSQSEISPPNGREFSGGDLFSGDLSSGDLSSGDLSSGDLSSEEGSCREGSGHQHACICNER